MKQAHLTQAEWHNSRSAQRFFGTLRNGRLASTQEKLLVLVLRRRLRPRTLSASPEDDDKKQARFENYGPNT